MLRFIGTPKWPRAPRSALVLAIEVAVMAAVLAVSGSLRLERDPDSAVYENASALGGRVTLGYPILLSAVRVVSASFAALPLIQFLLHVAAVTIFFRAYHRVFGSPRASLVVTSVLLWSLPTLRYVGHMLTDAPASSLAIVVAAMLLLAVRYPSRRWHWVGLGAAMFCSYQIRPVYVFLVVLVPVAGVTLSLILGPGPHRYLGLALILVSVVPFLGFGAFRRAVIGNAGVTSATGRHLSAVVAQFLTKDLVSELPDGDRPLAKEILAYRATVAAVRQPVNELGEVDFAAMQRSYVPMELEVCVPASAALYGGDPSIGDARLLKLSLAVIRARPRLYKRWLVRAFQEGLVVLVGNRGFLLLMGAFAVLHVLYLHESRGLGVLAHARSHRDEFNALLVLGVTYALVNLAAIVLVQVPICRYVEAAGIFLPAVPALGVFIRLDQVRSLRVARAREDRAPPAN